MEGSKRQRLSPDAAGNKSDPGGFREVSRQHSSREDLSPRWTAEERRRADIERRLNSALGSHKPDKAHKFAAPEKHIVRSKQEGSLLDRHHPSDLRERAGEKLGKELNARIVELKADGLSRKDRNGAERRHLPIPYPERIVTSIQNKPRDRAQQQSRGQGTAERLRPRPSEKSRSADMQTKLEVAGDQSDQSLGLLEEGEAQEDLLSLGNDHGGVASSAEQPEPPVKAPEATVRPSEATAHPTQEAHELSLPDQAAADHLPSLAPSFRDTVSSSPGKVLGWAHGKTTKTDVLAASLPAPDARAVEKPASLSEEHIDDVPLGEDTLPVTASVSEKGEIWKNRTADFDFGANFISLV